MGTGPGALHPDSAGNGLAANARNYRITDADAVVRGSPREKFRLNARAIELLRAIEAERRTATPEERSELVKYTGWGGLPQVFATASAAPKWRAEQERLESLLTQEEHTAARSTVLNAHYTSPTVIRALYAGLERLGFTGGRVLEPACGLGHFFGLMPPDMAARSQLTGIEIDPLTARLAAQLYPDAEIRAQPFEAAPLASNSFDLAISNVPFGDYAPFDVRLNARKFRIHDYYFVAALERVRPGGLVVFITSRGTMDKRQSYVRETIAAQADLVAAFRLPNTAFKENANTEVTTDVLFLRKRAEGEAPAGPAWIATKSFDVGGPQPIQLNEYYHAHPQQLLGRMVVAKHGLYGRNEPELASDGRDLGEALAAAVATLPTNLYRAPAPAETAAGNRRLAAPPDVKPYAYALTDLGEVARREGDELVLQDGLSPAVQRRIRGLIRVRDAVRECLRTQVENFPDETIIRARERLNLEYDQFTAQYGPVSQLANYRVFAGDPDLPLLLSLENYDEEANTAAKTAIFHERTIQSRTAVREAATAKEALVVTLSEKGRVDLAHMAQLLGRAPEQFLPELRGALFRDPSAVDRWVTDDEYLSGNVRAKLAAAEAVARKRPEFQVNVEALRAVQPADLAASEIDARLGSVWIPTDDIAQFVRDTLDVPAHDTITVRHVAEHGLWTVDVGYFTKRSVANITEWGTERATAHELIEAALNLRTPTIFDHDANDKPVLNPTATEAAREKQQKLKDRFTQWIFADDARRERLVAQYNREFNCYRVRTFNGDHLSLPGASATIALRAHQKAAAWRILQSPNVLLAHVVGSGKTFTMCAAAMELKRLGLARKPMIVVPNHMLGQFSSEFLLLYPGANILVASRDDFEGDGRRLLMSRIATSNWDAVIVTHSGFERLPISAEARKRFADDQIAELEERIREVKGDGGGTRIVKQLESAKKRLKAKLETMAATHRKDNTLTFEELGVDRLFVDEAQAFKNLYYVTKMTRVAGLPQTASGRAFDMLLKVRHVQCLNDGGGVTFATGTPVTNTMAEMFTMQRYLQPAVLRRQRLDHFDSWAATFGETVTAMELSPDGAGYRLNTRFARFVNVPELMHLFRQMADVQTADMLNLPTPALEGGRARIVSAPCTAELKAVVAALAKRAEKLKTEHVDPRDDNMLKITSEGRKAALDLRLVRAHARDHADSKVNQLVREVFSVWRETQAARSTQLVFCDLSTPKIDGRAFSAYQDIRTKLVSAGVPQDEIAFIQQHDTDASKLALFKDVRRGRVRVLLGSTQKMGAGTNVQAKLIALHHLDAPWRPADIEQREGRILRQGNSNSTVRILRYVTEGSFDAYMWQTLETKAKFISQIMKGECTARRIEDLESPALTYAEVKAIASGNPAVIEKAKVDAEVMRLTRLQAEHTESQYYARRRAQILPEDIKRIERAIENHRKDLALRRETQGDAFRMMLDGRTYTERVKAGEALVYLVGGDPNRQPSGVVGELAGFAIENRPISSEPLVLRGNEQYSAKTSASPLGIIASLEHAARSIEVRLANAEENLIRARRTAEDLAAVIGKPFEHADRLRELTARQAELVEALDLTKNQSSERLDGDTGKDDAPENGEAIAEQFEASERPRRKIAV